MSNLRFYSPELLTVGQTINLNENAATHATKVLRLKLGQQLTLFSGDGYDYMCTLSRLEKKAVQAQVLARNKVNNESSLKISLLQGIAGGERMDYIIQKAVELGVKHIYPINTKRSVVKLSAERVEKRVEHWQAVAISACEQCGRAIIPTMHQPLSLQAWLAQYAHDYASRILLNPLGAKRLVELDKPQQAIALLIGAEGGHSDDEITLAEQCGFQPVMLGPRILRTETAGLTAIASMQALWGDF